MKTNKRDIFIMLNAFILFICISASISLSIEAQKKVPKNLLAVSSLFNDPQFNFSKSEYENGRTLIENALFSIAYEGLTKKHIYTDGVRTFPRVFYVNSNYFTFIHMDFVDGSYWSPEYDASRVIVINESLAWNLFGNTHVVGKEVEIDSQPYKIIGVVKQNSIAKSQQTAWMPIVDETDKPILNTIFFQELHYEARTIFDGAAIMLSTNIKNKKQAEEMSERYEGYRLTAFNDYTHAFKVRVQILISFIWLIIFAYLIRELISCIRCKCYKANRLELLKFIFTIIFTAISLIILARTPEIFVNFPYYINGFPYSIWTALTGIDVLPQPYLLPDNLAQLYWLNIIQLLWLFVGCINILNLVYCIFGQRKRKASVHMNEAIGYKF